VKPSKGRTGQRLTNKVKAYIAGLFDGEGCIWYSRTLRVSITSCYPHHLQDIRDTFKFGQVRRVYKQGKNRRSCYRWEASGKYAEQFLEAIQEFLKEKQYQAELGLRLGRHSPKTVTHSAILRELKLLKKVNY